MEKTELPGLLILMGKFEPPPPKKKEKNWAEPVEQGPVEATVGVHSLMQMT